MVGYCGILGLVYLDSLLIRLQGEFQVSVYEFEIKVFLSLGGGVIYEG